MQQMGQTLGQRLEQRMSQSQIQSLDILAMPTVELRERIAEELAENPALELIHGTQQISPAPTGQAKLLERKEPYYRNDRTSSSFSTEASDVFQTFLENIPAPQQQSLQSHLLEQLFVHKLDPLTASFAERIIGNLTNDGFHVVPLNELFKTELSKNKGEKALAFTRHKISHALSVVRRLDPIGCATRDFKQSLLVQAKILFHKKTEIDPVYAYTIDILAHHFAYLEKARPYSLVRAVNENKEIPYKLTQENAEDILALIASLNPFPGRAFTPDITPDEYIIPTAFIERNDQEFTVRINNLEVPILTVSPEFQDLISHAKDSDSKTYIKEQMQKAKVFIGSLNQREKTIVAVLRKIVSVQEAFFLTGDKRRLVPLTQQQIAKELDVHESTVSRAVAGKYVQCQWGTFEIQYFFTNAVAVQPQSSPIQSNASLESGAFLQSNASASSTIPATREGVKDCIKELLTEHTAKGSKLSDQKISDLLQEKYGISVARRTVAKYRKELDIGSSYDRA
ncbi:RNA polymerase factor sigma-54 [Treponema sp. OMZ 857]|uniref:RNA polymerase factor sigma-54 n=1 Tax=Treponema sp. OMZ 857 TaxID=1643513 RepID=UPI0020A4F4C6|nr:RNA polymerase factor sigma-54 [Treponema sp. OMZ 857]UTC42678.1 RNA polymerase factor sigma-54 [Treponema sp. OMZ 857]